jgi:hypothetical protein
MRSIYRQRRVVPVSLASRVGGRTYYEQRAAIVVACTAWGSRWQGCMVRCLCDNSAVVAIIRSGSRDPCAMHLMLCLSSVAHYQLVLTPALYWENRTWLLITY